MDKDDNIDASPNTELANPNEPEQILATRSKRMLAATLDSIISLGFVLPLLKYSGALTYLEQGQVLPYNLAVSLNLLTFAFFVVVHGYLLKYYGQTIGKRLVGIKITDLAGNVPTFDKLIIFRYFIMSSMGLVPILLIQFIPLFDVLFIFRKDRRCLHDFLAGTMVVNVQPSKGTLIV